MNKLMRGGLFRLAKGDLKLVSIFRKPCDLNIFTGCGTVRMEQRQPVRRLQLL